MKLHVPRNYHGLENIEVLGIFLNIKMCKRYNMLVFITCNLTLMPLNCWLLQRRKLTAERSRIVFVFSGNIRFMGKGISECTWSFLLLEPVGYITLYFSFPCFPTDEECVNKCWTLWTAVLPVGQTCWRFHGSCKISNNSAGNFFFICPKYQS